MSISNKSLNLSKKQLLILVSIIVVGILSTAALYLIVAEKEQETITQDFIATSKEATAKIEKEISLNLEALNSINSLYSVTNSISRAQFKTFNNDVLSRISSIQALEWIPRVKFEDKLLFEKMAQADGLNKFRITEKDKDVMVRVSKRDEYYPVFYMEPLLGNEKALGFDLASDLTRLAALKKATSLNTMVATSRITLVQEERSQNGILVFSPVMKEGSVFGFVLGVFRVGDLISRALGVMENQGYNLFVYDLSGVEGDHLLAQYNEDNELPNDAVFSIPNGMHYQQTLNIADREWLVLCTPTQASLKRTSYYAELVLLICIILSTGIFYNFRRSFKEVNQQKQNQTLLEAKVKERTQELEEYAYVVSHDLKSPLRSIDALINWLKEDNKGKFDKDSLKNFTLIESTLEKMERLISDILSHSSIDASSSKNEVVNLNKLVNSLREVILIPKHISISILNKLPIINGDSVKLQQVFQNLINNAIKFNDKEKGIIEIDVLDKNEFYQFSIRDNGVGIEKQFHDKIFKLFQALHPNHDSTGIGLSVVKKIITKYGGEIWVESEKGVGSTFYFTLKK